MVSKKIILAMILTIFANFISAADTQDVEKVEKTVDGEDAGILVVVEVANEDGTEGGRAEGIADIDPDDDETHCCYNFCQFLDKGLAALGTAKGATGVACFTGITQGVLNLGWAFNWAKHAGIDPDLSMTIQEICGIIASLEIILLGAMFPYMMHKYAQNNPVPAKKDE